ncbi:MAG: PKD domain-containing protein [Methanobacteriota archaeon]
MALALVGAAAAVFLPGEPGAPGESVAPLAAAPRPVEGLNLNPVLVATLNGNEVHGGESVRVRPGDMVIVDLTGSFDPDGAIGFWGIDYGDGKVEGGTDISKARVMHSYETDAVFSLFAGIKDESGGVAGLAPVVQLIVDPAAAANERPVAREPPAARSAYSETGGLRLRASDLEPFVGETVTFVARPSGAARATSYSWDFGDGTTQSGTDLDMVNHAFAAAGTYDVSVRVAAEDGASSLQSVLVSVSYREIREEAPKYARAPPLVNVFSGRACARLPGSVPNCDARLLVDPSPPGDARGRLSPQARQVLLRIEARDTSGRPLADPGVAVFATNVTWRFDRAPATPFPSVVGAMEFAWNEGDSGFYSPLLLPTNDEATILHLSFDLALEYDGVLSTAGTVVDGALVVDVPDVTQHVEYDVLF